MRQSRPTPPRRRRVVMGPRPTLAYEVRIRGECGECGAHAHVTLPFAGAAMLPGNPIVLYCSVCSGWRAAEIVALERV